MHVGGCVSQVLPFFTCLYRRRIFLQSYPRLQTGLALFHLYAAETNKELLTHHIEDFLQLAHANRLER